MVRDYISKVEYIQALQYNTRNKEEILNWLGSKNCFITENKLRVRVNNSEDSILLINGDYIVKRGGAFKVLAQEDFEDRYHQLPVGFDDSIKMMLV